MKSFLKVFLKLMKFLLIITIVLGTVLFLVYLYVKNTGYDEKYLTYIAEEKTIPLENFYYDSKQKNLVISLNDELVSAYFKPEKLTRELKKCDLEITDYGFDINVENSEVYFYLKVIYKKFLPLDGYIIFDYKIESNNIIMDIKEVKVEKIVNVSLEKLKELNFKTNYKLKYPAIEVGQMITIDRNYLTIDSYFDDKLIIKYNLYDYIYHHYKTIYEESDDSYNIYRTIEKYGLDKFVENNYTYVVSELESYGIDIR